jgi:Ca2+-binding RTX toxin-like protein
MLRNGRLVSCSGRQQANKSRLRLTLETLDERIVPAVTASFTPGTGILSVLGDAGNNNIVVSRDAAGQILVNGGAVAVQGGTATVANTALIQVFGLAGNDTITLDEANGALPAANLFGGAGNDVLTGGSGNDMLFGQAGNDTLLGKGGNDFLFGGDGNDVLIGGTGDDQVFGEAGDDRMIWNPGDGTDLNEGGDGNDTVEVNGGNASENFTVVANGSRVRFDRVSPAPFTIDIGTSENLVVNMNGGDDTFTAGNGLASLISLTVDGGAGNDTITGGDGNDKLMGGDGNDVIIGGRGNDVMIGGAGDDTFVWNPGDGSDTIEGQDGNDTLQFNGANIDEKIDVSANGSHVRFTRDVANITMDLNGIENVNFKALGGADTITVGDLSGTDVTNVNLDLNGPTGTGDGAIDTVIVNGTNRADTINVAGAGSSYSVTGLHAAVNVTGSEGANDALLIQALGGKDTVNASALQAGVVKLTIDGGTGDDVIVGSQGDDVLIGGDGNDTVTGGRGNDLAQLGAGNDVFIWNPGDGSDTVEGQDGTDQMIFNGANISEKIDVSANGHRVRFTRDVGNITMDLNGVETVDFNALGGADTVTVNDLTGTDLKLLRINFAGSNGAPDGAQDSLIVNGTAGNDVIKATTANGETTVSGLAAMVKFSGVDAGVDLLTINGQAGDDVIDASKLQANLVQLTLNGGDGNDLLIGSAGNDLINGGRGNDTAQMGAGDDVFVWNPGDGSDTVEGQGGFDRMVFNGANVNEKFEVSANGQRVRFTRDVGNITMDLNGVEAIDLNALGGADTVTVNNLSGTALQELNLDLGGNDGQADNVIVSGTNGDDVVMVAGDSNGVTVAGLATRIKITGAEAANDRLTVNALAGDDVVTATGLAAGTIQFTADGGDGDDVLIGSAGNDVLLGSAGNDVLIGGGGQDRLDGGAGSNTVI